MILVLAAEIYPMKTKGCHPVEKLILLKAAFTCAPKETNNWKALKGIPKLSQSFTTVFSPSHSCHGVNSHLVYVGKISHYSEPNYTCFSILIVLNYAQFQKLRKKKKKKWNLCVQRDLFIWFFRIIQVRKSFFPSLPSTFSSLPQCFELHRCHLWLQICSHRSGDCKINLITFGLFLWPSLIFSYWLLLGAHWVRWHLEWTKWSNHTQLSQCHTNFYGLDKSLCIC